MKKIAICFLLLALSTLLMAVAPVFAEPAQKIPITMVHAGSTVITETRQTNGGIFHYEGIRTGTCTLNIQGQAPLVGTYSESVHEVVNTKTGEVVIQNFAVLTFAGGSFEGMKQNRVSSSGPTTITALDQHAVLHGTGIFEGQTLMVSQEAPPFPPIYTGFLLKH
jgi:hypothetical protein